MSATLDITAITASITESQNVHADGVCKGMITPLEVAPWFFTSGSAPDHNRSDQVQSMIALSTKIETVPLSSISTGARTSLCSEPPQTHRDWYAALALCGSRLHA